MTLLQRANPVARGLDWELAAALPTGILAVLLCGADPAASLARGLPARVVGVQALAVLLLSAVVPVRSRCSRLQLGFPVAARQLWLSQWGGLLARGAAILTVAGAAAVLGELALRGSAAPPGLPVLLARLVAGYLLGIAVLQSPWPRLYRIPLRLSYFLMLCAVLAVLVSWIATVGDGGPIEWGWVLGLAAGVTALNYRAIPAAYSLEPLAPMVTADRALTRRHAALPRDLQLTRWLLGRALWLYLPILGLMGFLVTGTYGFTPAARSMWLFYVLLAAMHLLTFVLGASDRLGTLEHLPVSRRRLLALVFVPGLAFTALGYLGGDLFAGSRIAIRAPLARCGETAVPCLDVPGALHEVAAVDRPPVIEAPWGERHVLRPVPIVPGSPLGVYSPWDAPESASTEFVAWQLWRALKATYGDHFDPAEVDRYVRADEVGDGAGAKALEDELLDLGPPLVSVRGRLPVGFLCLAVAATWILGVAFAATPRFGGKLTSARWEHHGPWVVPMGIGWLLAVAIPIVSALGDAEAWALPTLIDVLSRQVTQAGWLAEAGVLAAFLALGITGYRLAEKSYASVEAPRFSPGASSVSRDLGLDV